ncbi:MAG: hypothetical protein C0616_15025 [Desulfuromonas sp.]|nr:MAG: hypothetical protein C0616_15025 [Desulfuromonas sp.]
MRDPVMTVLFVVFLAGFVLMGMYPTLQRFAGRLRRMLGEVVAEVEAQSDEERHDGEYHDDDPVLPASNVMHDRHPPLDGYAWFAFRQIAQGGRTGLSFRQIRDALHVETAAVREVLETLQQQGLVAVVVRMPLRVRYVLTKRGRAHPTAGPSQGDTGSFPAVGR